MELRSVLVGVVLGQFLSLAIISISTAKWFDKFVRNLRDRVMLYRVMRAYKRVNRANDAANRIIRSI